MGAEAAQQERDGGQPWDGVFRRSIDVELRVLNEGERSIEVTASDETLDSHGDVLKAFWDLKRYEKNPVVLWNHNIFESSRYSMGGAVRPEDVFPIGRAENVRVEGKKLKAKLILGSAEYSAVSQKVFLGCKEKIIRAVSVGFRQGGIVPIRNKVGITTHYELGTEESPNELREISFVPMGSNPNAIVAKSIAFEREQLERLLTEQGQHAAVRGQQETQPMAMTAEEKAAYDKAIGEAASAKADASKAVADVKAATDRAERAEALNETLKGELKAAQEARDKADQARSKTALDALQGKKFGKAEREKLDGLVKKVGLDDVLDILATRADLGVTQAATVDGEELRSSDQPAPAPVEGEGGDAGADIVKAALAAA